MASPEPPCTPPPRSETPATVDTNEVETETQPVNVLWDLFTREMQDRRTLTDTLADHVTGPKNIKDTPSSSLYWVLDDDDQPCVLRFPAILDMRGNFGQTGPYFSQGRPRKLSFDDFRKMKASFELGTLPSMQNHDGNQVYPPEAVECSQRMFKFLHICTHKLESERNKGLKKDDRAVSYGFFKNYLNAREEVKSSFFVSSPPFFVDIEDPSTVDDLSDQEIDWASQKMSQMLNNEELTQTFHGKRRAGRSSELESDSGLTLDDLSDQNGRYSQLKEEGHGPTKLIVPHVFDKEGDLILPTDYVRKLSHEIPVMVDVQLRVWEFLPKSGGASGSPIKQKQQASKNGTRRYQLVLKSMKLLAAYAPESPSKRKAGRSTLDNFVCPNRPGPPDSPTPAGPKRARR